VFRQRRRQLYRTEMLAPGVIWVAVGMGNDPGIDAATILVKEITVRGS
jgi:hypothetical protein